MYKAENMNGYRNIFTQVAKNAEVLLLKLGHFAEIPGRQKWMWY